ncbi:hypothetical protein BH09PSE3_BH09PSE3_00810 [soil metagenome]
MSTTTDRLKLPFLEVAQGQKEMTHNEALVLLDIAVQPVVQSIAPPDIPPAPMAGQCWIIGATPTGEWAGRSGSLAAWTDGGWRFVLPFEGMTVWSIADNLTARRSGSVWVIGNVVAKALIIDGQQIAGARRPAIPAPSGGITIDLQARNSLIAILDTLVSHGLIS